MGREAIQIGPAILIPTIGNPPISSIPRRPELIPIDFLSPGVFPSTVLGVWKFDDTLTDEVSQNDFVQSTGSPDFQRLEKFELLQNSNVVRSSLLFEAGKTYSVAPTYSYSTNFTMAFWWFSPGAVGFTRHVTTREQEPKVAPIIAKSDFSTGATTVTLSNASFVVAEVASSETKNAIRVYLSTNGSDVSHIITSESYSPGLRYVLFTYIASQGRFRIDIDGKVGILHSAPTTSLQTTGALRINTGVPGFVAHQTTQTDGFLFDLVFTAFGSFDNEALKGMRYGFEHITFTNLLDARFGYFGLSYQQPNTVSTTDIFVEGGNIFATRSNGEIVKGDRPIWDRDFNYPTQKSLNFLNKSPTDTDAQCTDSNSRVIELTPDGLCIRGATIRV